MAPPSPAGSDLQWQGSYAHGEDSDADLAEGDELKYVRYSSVYQSAAEGQAFARAVAAGVAHGGHGSTGEEVLIDEDDEDLAQVVRYTRTASIAASSAVQAARDLAVRAAGLSERISSGLSSQAADMALQAIDGVQHSSRPPSLPLTATSSAQVSSRSLAVDAPDANPPAQQQDAFDQGLAGHSRSRLYVVSSPNTATAHLEEPGAAALTTPDDRIGSPHSTSGWYPDASSNSPRATTAPPHATQQPNGSGSAGVNPFALSAPFWQSGPTAGEQTAAGASLEAPDGADHTSSAGIRGGSLPTDACREDSQLSDGGSAIELSRDVQPDSPAQQNACESGLWGAAGGPQDQQEQADPAGIGAAPEVAGAAESKAWTLEGFSIVTPDGDEGAEAEANTAVGRSMPNDSKPVGVDEAGSEKGWDAPMDSQAIGFAESAAWGQEPPADTAGGLPPSYGHANGFQADGSSLPAAARALHSTPSPPASGFAAALSDTADLPPHSYSEHLRQSQTDDSDQDDSRAAGSVPSDPHREDATTAPPPLQTAPSFAVVVPTATTWGTISGDTGSSAPSLPAPSLDPLPPPSPPPPAYDDLDLTSESTTALVPPSLQIPLRSEADSTAAGLATDGASSASRAWSGSLGSTELAGRISAADFLHRINSAQSLEQPFPLHEAAVTAAAAEAAAAASAPPPPPAYDDLDMGDQTDPSVSSAGMPESTAADAAVFPMRASQPRYGASGERLSPARNPLVAALAVGAPDGEPTTPAWQPAYVLEGPEAAAAAATAAAAAGAGAAGVAGAVSVSEQPAGAAAVVAGVAPWMGTGDDSLGVAPSPEWPERPLPYEAARSTLQPISRQLYPPAEAAAGDEQEEYAPDTDAYGDGSSGELPGFPTEGASAYESIGWGSTSGLAPPAYGATHGSAPAYGTAYGDADDAVDEIPLHSAQRGTSGRRSGSSSGRGVLSAVAEPSTLVDDYRAAAGALGGGALAFGPAPGLAYGMARDEDAEEEEATEADITTIPYQVDTTGWDEQYEDAVEEQRTGASGAVGVGAGVGPGWQEREGGSTGSGAYRELGADEEAEARAEEERVLGKQESSNRYEVDIISGGEGSGDLGAAGRVGLGLGAAAGAGGKPGLAAAGVAPAAESLADTSAAAAPASGGIAGARAVGGGGSAGLPSLAGLRAQRSMRRDPFDAGDTDDESGGGVEDVPLSAADHVLPAVAAVLSRHEQEQQQAQPLHLQPGATGLNQRASTPAAAPAPPPPSQQQQLQMHHSQPDAVSRGWPAALAAGAALAVSAGVAAVAGGAAAAGRGAAGTAQAAVGSGGPVAPLPPPVVGVPVGHAIASQQASGLEDPRMVPPPAGAPPHTQHTVSPSPGYQPQQHPRQPLSHQQQPLPGMPPHPFHPQQLQHAQQQQRQPVLGGPQGFSPAGSPGAHGPAISPSGSGAAPGVPPQSMRMGGQSPMPAHMGHQPGRSPGGAPVGPGGHPAHGPGLGPAPGQSRGLVPGPGVAGPHGPVPHGGMGPAGPGQAQGQYLQGGPPQMRQAGGSPGQPFPPRPDMGLGGPQGAMHQRPPFAPPGAMQRPGGAPPRPQGPHGPMTHGPMGPRPPAPPPPGLVGPYPGLLYTEGRDTLGRPVVVLNTAMLPAKAKKEQVLEYVLGALQPLVQQEYVIVVLSLGTGVKAATVSSVWALGAYRRLAKPYRKNVKHIVLVQPSAWARALLAMSQPFVSKKAAHKVKKIDSLVEIAEATNGEVKLESLGARFVREVQYGVGAPPLAGLVPPGAAGGLGPGGPPRGGSFGPRGYMPPAPGRGLPHGGPGQGPHGPGVPQQAMGGRGMGPAGQYRPPQGPYQQQQQYMQHHPPGMQTPVQHHPPRGPGGYGHDQLHVPGPMSSGGVTTPVYTPGPGVYQGPRPMGGQQQWMRGPVGG